jgi:3-mercaptopyruvate sulfurtransferase SseA
MSGPARSAIVAAMALAGLLVGAAQTEIPDAPVNFISVDELKSLLDRGTKVDLIDVRRREAYLQQHIKGARSIPLQTFPEGAQGIKKTGLVVFY